MILFQGYSIVFQEVPDEISLAFNIADCGHHCKGCHSPNLQKAEGQRLVDNIMDIINQYKNVITCVCFFGQGQDVNELKQCLQIVTANGYKTCLYTGDSISPISLKENLLDYIKIGSYNQALGGLDSVTTNQRMYKWDAQKQRAEDITYMFQKKKI